MDQARHLTDRLALVTGAGGGLGRHLSLALAEAGARIAVHYVESRGPAEALVERIRADGGAAHAFQADLSERDASAELIERVEASLGGVDVLVNNAATTARVPWEDLAAATDELWWRILQVNLMAPVALTRAVMPGMAARGWGRILNISSTSGVGPTGSSLPYAVSKSALLALTENLAAIAPPGVSVCAIAPGWMDTGWAARLHDDAPAAAASEATGPAEVAPEVEVAEVADLAVGLLRGTGANGATLVLDSGTGLRHAHLSP